MKISKKIEYLSLLRGINVGGHKIIKMAELRSLYEEIGFSEVQSYIQSGNVLFNSDITKSAHIEQKLNSAIQKKYGFEVAIYICSTTSLKQICKETPFKEKEVEENHNKILLTLLSKHVEESDIVPLRQYLHSSESLHMDNNTLYLYAPNGYAKTKLTNARIESTLSSKLQQGTIKLF